MLFTFKRDEEGREHIYVDDVCVAQCLPLCTQHDGEYLPVQDVPGVDGDLIVDAIERADEAGFWGMSTPSDARLIKSWGMYRVDEVIVNVPVAEISTTLVVVSEGDE
jgi:hypothetical protein